MRSANLIGQERSSDRIDLYFIFQWTRSVFMRGGAIHDWTTFVILCNASMKRNGQPTTTDTLPLTLTPIFSGRKAKINLHTTPKLTEVIPICCYARIQEFSSIWQKKLWQRCLFVCCFFLSPRLRSQMVNSKKNIIFKVPEGVQIFSGGSNFFQGGGGLIAYSL